MIEPAVNELAPACEAAGSIARRRQRWRAAQKARRERQQARGKALLRMWCTPEEAAAAREAVKKIRRAALLRKLELRAQQHAMRRHLSASCGEENGAAVNAPVDAPDARVREGARHASIHHPRKAGDRHE